MKRFLSLFLTVLLVTVMMVPAVSAEEYRASARYANIAQASSLLYIDENGLAEITLRCVGTSSVTKISAKFYLEIKEGDSWTIVVFDPDAPYFRATSNSSLMLETRKLALSTKGEYRLTAIFTVVGSTTETLTLHDSATY